MREPQRMPCPITDAGGVIGMNDNIAADDLAPGIVCGVG